MAISFAFPPTLEWGYNSVHSDSTSCLILLQAKIGETIGTVECSPLTDPNGPGID